MLNRTVASRKRFLVLDPGVRAAMAARDVLPLLSTIYLAPIAEIGEAAQLQFEQKGSSKFA
jgi:hypothetical protein